MKDFEGTTVGFERKKRYVCLHMKMKAPCIHDMKLILFVKNFLPQAIIKSKIEKVPRGILGEKSSKDMALRKEEATHPLLIFHFVKLHQHV